jgi:hypothetical protein
MAKRSRIHEYAVTRVACGASGSRMCLRLLPLGPLGEFSLSQVKLQL